MNGGGVADRDFQKSFGGAAPGGALQYRMLAEGTIEEKIWELQQRKQALVTEVLGEDGFARTLTAEDLDYLLE